MLALLWTYQYLFAFRPLTRLKFQEISKGEVQSITQKGLHYTQKEPVC